MTSTDRAFIAAIQQANSGLSGGMATPHSSGSPQASASQKAETLRPTRAPLSEHLARRREGAAQRTRAANRTADRSNGSVGKAPLRPGVEVDSLRWPEVVSQLETQARKQLLGLLSQSTRAGKTAEAPAIAFVSATPGVGGTTALLATARLIASVGGKVAILDLTTADGAATQLGVRRVAHLDGRLDATAIDDLLVTSRDHGTSVLAAEGERLAQAALGRLTETHDLVLIDAGVAGSASDLLASEALASASVLLVDSVDAATRGAALTKLASAGITVEGVVETFADAA